MKNQFYPLTFSPIYKDYLWGGSRIPKTYNRDLPEGIYAESWEITDRDDGMSVVTNGWMKGKTLHEILQDAPQKIMGSAVKGTQFPLLIKLIDAKQKLSVQVHPNDESAQKFGGEAKTELWHFLGENPTQVYCEFKEGITPEIFLEHVKEKRDGETMHPVPVKKDSTVFVRGGRVHAIGEGCLILEIQQNSNTTYRISDWGRVGNDGKPRDLHLDQALQVINWDDHEDPIIQPKTLVNTSTFKCIEVSACEYFRLEKLIYSTPQEIPMTGKTFHALFVSEGVAEILWDSESLIAPAGTSILIPASLPAYTLGGEATVLRTTIPE